MKRKLAIGFFLAAFLTLVAAGAVAAERLSVRNIVDEHAIPMANESSGDTYSAEETRKLLSLAEENGIELSQAAKESISRSLQYGEGYYKEEMIMALAKAEFGEAPASWSLEVQKWFDDACVAIGFVDEPQKAMPSADEITQEAALQKAVNYIETQYGSSYDLNDPSIYRIGVQYINGLADGAYNGNYWSVQYEPLTLEAAEYWVYLNNQGDVWNSSARFGITENAEFDTVCDRYQAIYGWDYRNWDHSILQSFHDAVTHCKPSNSRMYLSLMQTDYPDIGENAISPDLAAQLGAEAVHLDKYQIESTVYIGATPNPVWRIGYYVQTGEESGDYYAVEVDSLTGEVKSTEQKNGGYMYHSIVLKDVYEEVERNWADNSPSVG